MFGLNQLIYLEVVGDRWPATPTLLKFDGVSGEYQIYMQFLPLGLPIHRRFYIGAFFSPDDVKAGLVPETASVVVVIGRLVVEEKDLDTLLRAWYKLRYGRFWKLFYVKGKMEALFREFKVREEILREIVGEVVGVTTR